MKLDIPPHEDTTVPHGNKMVIVKEIMQIPPNTIRRIDEYSKKSEHSEKSSSLQITPPPYLGSFPQYTGFDLLNEVGVEFKSKFQTVETELQQKNNPIVSSDHILLAFGICAHGTDKNYGCLQNNSAQKISIADVAPIGSSIWGRDGNENELLKEILRMINDSTITKEKHRYNKLCNQYRKATDETQKASLTKQLKKLQANLKTWESTESNPILFNNPTQFMRDHKELLTTECENYFDPSECENYFDFDTSEDWAKEEYFPIIDDISNAVDFKSLYPTICQTHNSSFYISTEDDVGCYIYIQAIVFNQHYAFKGKVKYNNKFVASAENPEIEFSLSQFIDKINKTMDELSYACNLLGILMKCSSKSFSDKYYEDGSVKKHQKPKLRGDSEMVVEPSSSSSGPFAKSSGDSAKSSGPFAKSSGDSAKSSGDSAKSSGDSEMVVLVSQARGKNSKNKKTKQKNKKTKQKNVTKNETKKRNKKRNKI